MTITNGDKPNNSRERKILWVSSIILDVHLHKTSLLGILKHLAERGDNITLIAMRSKNVFTNENSQVRIISVPLRYVPVVSPVMFAIVIFFLLPVYIINFKPNFIIARPDVSILSLIPGLLFFKLKKIKLILDVRTTPVETVQLRGFLRKLDFVISILVAKKLFDGMTIITPLMKKEICNRFYVNPDKVGVWTDGVSTTLFNPRNYISESMELRRKLGLSGKFVVFYHGAFSDTRGLTETINAMTILKSKYPNVVFFLLGTGPILQMLRTVIHKNDLQNNVVIHSPVDHSEVPKFISMSDVCIVPLPNHPYWRFQCPLKLLEYLAMEKVAILTDIPAHRLIVGKEKCGIYISSIKPIEIAKSILYAYRNKEKLEEWGATGRTIIDEKYSWEKVAKDLESYLLSIDDKVALGEKFGKK